MDIHALRYCKHRRLARFDSDPRCELMPLEDGALLPSRHHPCNAEDCPTHEFAFRSDAVLADVDEIVRGKGF